MERQVIEERIEEIRKLATELRHQGERCALAGLLGSRLATAANEVL